MKLASFSLASLLFLAACHSREARMIDELSAPEKAAFLAAERYRSCTQVFVQKAKAEHQKLSDDDLRRFGYRCPSELQSLAKAVDAYWMNDKRKHRDDPAAYSPDRSVRVAFHKRELAGGFAWCEFRKCHRTD